MASAVEVVGQIQSKAAAQIALKAEVCLLRIGINKVLSLRIAEGLNASGMKVDGFR